MELFWSGTKRGFHLLPQPLDTEVTFARINAEFIDITVKPKLVENKYLIINCIHVSTSGNVSLY